MEVMELISNYKLIVLIAGVVSSVICGIVKLILLRILKTTSQIIDNPLKKSQLLRRVCNTTLIISNVLICTLWLALTQGRSAFASVGLYSDILYAFTFSKVVYSLYEGAGVVSIKKLVKKVITMLRTAAAKDKDSETSTAPNIDIYEFVKKYFNDMASNDDAEIEDSENIEAKN